MTEMTGMRLLAAQEIATVSGGDIVVTGTPPIDPFILDQLDRLRFANMGFLDNEYGVGGGGGSVAPSEDEWDPDGDDDGDGIPNQDEEIVVTGDPAALERQMETYRNIATFLVTYAYYSGVAIGGYYGLAGRAGAGYLVGLEVFDDTRENMINAMVESMFEDDVADDGVANGSIFLQPGQDPDMEPGMIFYP